MLDLVELWVSQPPNPSSYGVFHSLKWAMSDHLCITKMRKYLQWTDFFFFFLHNSDVFRERIPFKSMLWPFFKICSKLSMRYQLFIYYNKIMLNSNKRKTYIWLSYILPINHVLHWCSSLEIWPSLLGKKINPFSNTNLARFQISLKWKRHSSQLTLKFETMYISLQSWNSQILTEI